MISERWSIPRFRSIVWWASEVVIQVQKNTICLYFSTKKEYLTICLEFIFERTSRCNTILYVHVWSLDPIEPCSMTSYILDSFWCASWRISFKSWCPEKLTRSSLSHQLNYTTSFSHWKLHFFKQSTDALINFGNYFGPSFQTDDLQLVGKVVFIQSYFT